MRCDAKSCELSGAGTEGQPGLLASLIIVVEPFVAVFAVAAFAGARLAVEIDGNVMTVTSLRQRPVDLSRVEAVGWRSKWFDGPAMVFAERSDEAKRRRLVTLPIGTVIDRNVDVPAWSDADLRRLLWAVYAELPDDVTFDGRAAERFVAVGCPIERA